MPVQVFPSTHGANPIRGSFVDDPMDVLQAAWPSARFHELVQSSFTGDDLPPAMMSSSNGFVYSVVKAYNQHHHLQIRPDDIWFAILTQMSIYINKHAEELREIFVAHQGQKELKLTYNVGDRHNMDFGLFARDMTKLLHENIVDPELRVWMLPDFTTTTPQDTVIASILMMGSLQKYFSFSCSVKCGLPSIKLLGEKEDYIEILEKLEKLSSFGKEPAQFRKLLEPVLSSMIRTFEDPTGEETLSFWQRVMCVERNASGPTYYSGWITAFCFWDEDGECLYKIRDVGGTWRKPVEHLSLNGVKYHKIDSDTIPPGWGKVPVKLDDNGEEIEAEMVAGSVGIACSDSGLQDESGAKILDTMQPQSGWWIYAKTKGEHPSLTGLRDRANARGFSADRIEDLVRRAEGTGASVDDWLA